jgi:uncharacterized protein YbaP (TraB family)
MIRRWLAGLLLALTTGAAFADPPMWVVRDHDSQLVIFGSVHLLPPDLKWETPALAKALAGADDVWFELPQGPDTEAQTQILAGRLGVLPPGQSLFRLLPPRDAESLLRVAQTYGADPVALDRLQPWLAEVALAGAAFKRAGAVADNGVEAVTNAQVPAAVPRRAFETPEQQITIFADQPLDDQVASLRETLAEMEADPDQFDKLVRAWMAHDLKAMDRQALAPLKAASPRLFRRLVSDRTDRWVRALDQRLKGSGHTVVIVGVGHLLGPQGLPAQLRALGYSVQGP